MIDQLIARVFEARNAAHLEHWKTPSYATHEALGRFYDSIIGLIDALVESHMGAIGKIGKVDLGPRQTKACVSLLGEHVVWISKNKNDIYQDIDALENIVDEIVSLYLTTLYKLKELS